MWKLRNFINWRNQLRPITIAACLCATPQIFAAPAKPAAPAATPAAHVYTVGERVNGQTGRTGSWYSATVTRVQGNIVEVLSDSGEAASLEPDQIKFIPPLDKQYAMAVGVGRVVSLHAGGSLIDGVVQELGEGTVRVKFFPGGGEEWVPRDRLRAPASRQTMGIAGADGIPVGDFSGVEDAQPNGAFWSSVKPDPVPTSKPANPKPITLNVPRLAPSKFDAPKRILFTDPKVGQALVVRHGRGAVDVPETCRYTRVNVFTGEPMELAALESDHELVAISPDGKQGVARVRINKPGDYFPFDSQFNSALQLLSLTGGKVTPGTTWRPYDFGAELRYVEFTDEEHLLTQSNEGVIVYWELPLPKAPSGTLPRALYRLRAGALGKPALSPGGKYFAVMDHKTLRVIETATGAHAGSIEDLGEGRSSIAFKPDGLLLAVAVGARVHIVHVPGGRVTRTILIPAEMNRSPRESLDWLGNAHLFLNNSILLDLGKRLATWQYHIPPQGILEVAHGRVWFAPDEQKKMLVSVVLPHEEALKVEPPVKADDLMIFKPGQKVTIEMNTDAPDDIKARVLKSLEQQIGAMGMSVAPDQPVRIQAITTSGNSRELQYQPFGIGARGGIQKVTVSDKIQRLIVTLDGAEVWKTQMTAGVASYVRLTKDQTIESAIAAEQAKSYIHLTGMRLPTVLLKNSVYTVAGHSKIGENGIEPYTGK